MCMPEAKTRQRLKAEISRLYSRTQRSINASRFNRFQDRLDLRRSMLSIQLSGRSDAIIDKLSGERPSRIAYRRGG